MKSTCCRHITHETTLWQHSSWQIYFPQKKSTVSQLEHEDPYGFWAPLWIPYVLGRPIKSLQQLQQLRLLICWPSPYILLLFQTHTWVRKGCLISGATTVLSVNPHKISSEFPTWSLTSLLLRHHSNRIPSTETELWSQSLNSHPAVNQGYQSQDGSLLTPSHSFSLCLGSREGYDRMQSSKTWNRAHL